MTGEWLDGKLIPPSTLQVGDAFTWPYSFSAHKASYVITKIQREERVITFQVLAGKIWPLVDEVKSNPIPLDRWATPGLYSGWLIKRGACREKERRPE